MEKLTTIQIPVHVRGDVVITPKINRMISEYAALLLSTVSTSTVADDNTGWADKFCGIWKEGKMSVDEQVAFLRESRSEARKSPFEL